MGLENLNDALEEIQRISIKTSQGEYVRVDEVQRLLKEKLEAKKEEAARPKPRTLQQARQMALDDEEFTSKFPKPAPSMGRSIQAAPEPSSRT